MENFFNDEIEKTVFISEEQLRDVRERKLYGRYFPDTFIFNVYPEELKERGEYLCTVQALETQVDETDTGLSASVSGGRLLFFSEGKNLKVESYGLYQSIFSRNKGILETDIMSGKRAVILGCGSVGSLVAMELARSGVGHFLLCDADIVEYHNICRHQCGIEDVGDLKVNALERKLKNINPSVDVQKYEGIAQNLPKAQLDAFCVPGDTVFVGCADNRAADVYTNRISIYYSSYFISIGFWERAYAGEIFYHVPDRGMPCYECALGDGGNISARAQANHHIYSNQELTEGMKFEPGISVDINFITTIGIKLAIDLLNLTNADYIPRVLNDLKQYTVVCNTSNPQIGGEMVEIFSYPLQITRSLVVGFGKASCVDHQCCRYELQEKQERQKKQESQE
ncbi:MAG: ThiF family adenylyltransferase [Lachnospiraceae bacterium]|nr:ThiF family adenylyltransferase [Lachnospiraceae bacterium]